MDFTIRGFIAAKLLIAALLAAASAAGVAQAQDNFCVTISPSPPVVGQDLTVSALLLSDGSAAELWELGLVGTEIEDDFFLEPPSGSVVNGIFTFEWTPEWQDAIEDPSSNFIIRRGDEEGPEIILSSQVFTGGGNCVGGSPGDEDKNEDDEENENDVWPLDDFDPGPAVFYFFWALTLVLWFILFLMFGVFNTSFEVPKERNATIVRYLFCGLIILVLPVIILVIDYIASNFF